MASKYDNPCFKKAADDEPIFVLRAHDRLAELVVRYWADLAQQAGVRIEKVYDARRVATDMRLWRESQEKLKHGIDTR